MAKKFGKCLNIGNCDIADQKKEVEILDGQDFVCPECGKELYAIKSSKPSSINWKKILLIAVPILIIILVAAKWNSFFGSGTSKSSDTQPDTASNVDEKEGKSPIKNDTTNYNLTSFNYTPPEVSAPNKVKGIIELGSRNFSYFIIKMDSQHNWDTIKANRNSTSYSQLMTGNAAYIEQQFSQYIEDMINDYGVNGKYIYFVVSSGAHQIDTVRMVEDHLQHIGYKVKIVTEDEEATYALRAALPKDFYNKSAFVVDIGSGNTKIAWIDEGNKIGTLSVKYGSKAVKDLKVPLEVVLSEYKRISDNIPKTRTDMCFIIGGLPWELSKLTKIENERYINLKSANCYNKLDGWKKDGLAMYNVIAQTTNCKQFAFDRKATFSIGYLVYGLNY